MMHTVASSDLLGFLPRWYVRDGVSKARLTEIRITHPTGHAVGISYRKDAYLSPAAIRFIDMLKQGQKESRHRKVRTASEHSE